MVAELLIVAGVLGLLGFFEPCTVATHTLFAARTHRDPRRARALAQLVVSRALLLAAAFSAAAAFGVAELPPGLAAAMLLAMGTIYLVTIRIYLPVPHLEVFRLLPGARRLPEGLRLGLTLPACVLPLLIVVGLLAAVTGRPFAAALAGLVFALLLTLPTVWLSLRGIDAAGRRWLAWAAHGSHYLTTALLWGGALLVWRGGF